MNNRGFDSIEDAPRYPYLDVMNMEEPRGRRGHNPDSREEEGQKSRTQKKLKKAKKAMKKLKKADFDEPDAEAAADAPPDGGTGCTDTAWTVVAGSAVVNSANSVVKLVLRETEESINADFSNRTGGSLNYSECFNGLNNSRQLGIIGEFPQVTECLDLGNPRFYDCLNSVFGNPRETDWPSWIAEFCSYLWTSNPPPPANLTESNSPVAAKLVAGDIFSTSGGTGNQDDVGTTLNMVFVFLSLGCILLAAVIAVFVGYRIVSLIGSLLVAAGFLAASFLSTDQNIAIQILVGGVAGAGSAFLRLAAIVAILELFEEKRMRAIVISGLGAVLINFLVLGLTFVEGLSFEWRTSFRFQLIPAGISFVAGLFLKPLKLKRRRSSQSRGHGKTCSRKCDENIFSKELFTNIVFYLVLVVYLLDQLGRPIFSDSMQPVLEEKNYSSLQVDLQPIIENGGALLGLLILLFWKKHDLADILVVMTGLNILIGLLALHVPEMSSYAWAVVYSAVFGFTDGIFASVLQDSIPEGFGKRHVRIVAGFLGFIAALGALGAEYIGNAIDDNVTGNHVSMYLSGACLIGSGVMAFLSRLIVNRAGNDEDIDSVDD